VEVFQKDCGSYWSRHDSDRRHHLVRGWAPYSDTLWFGVSTSNRRLRLAPARHRAVVGEFIIDELLGVDRDASHSHVFIRDRCHSECSVKPEVDSFARHSGRLNKHDGVGGHHVDYRPVVYPETSASGTRWTLRQ